jgi:hypothetical protein
MPDPGADPSGWRVYARDVGWFKARRGCLLVTTMIGTLTEASWQHFLEVLEADLRIMTSVNKVAVLYDMRLDPGVMTAKRRKALGELLARYDDKTSTGTLAYAFASRSITARAALQAIHWFSRPKYPAKVVDSPFEAMRFLAEHAPELPIAELWKSYDALVQRERPSLRPPPL